MLVVVCVLWNGMVRRHLLGIEARLDAIPQRPQFVLCSLVAIISLERRAPSAHLTPGSRSLDVPSEGMPQRESGMEKNIILICLLNIFSRSIFSGIFWNTTLYYFKSSICFMKIREYFDIKWINTLCCTSVDYYYYIYMYVIFLVIVIYVRWCLLQQNLVVRKQIISRRFRLRTGISGVFSSSSASFRQWYPLVSVVHGFFVSINPLEIDPLFAW